jgi:hypothetical protein
MNPVHTTPSYPISILILSIHLRLGPPSGLWVLRRIFGPKRDEVPGGWRKLHNEEFHDLYSSPGTIVRKVKSRRMRWAEHVTRIGEERNAYRLLVGKPEGKGPLGRPRRRRVDDIKLDLGEI